MRKIFLFTLSILLFMLMAAAISVPFLFKDKIVEKVKSAINENLNAKVDFKELDLSLISGFPNVALGINNLTVIGVDSFATDTLANIELLRLNLNLISVIKGEQYEVRSVELLQPIIKAKVLASGKTNWDIIKADTSKAAGAAASNFKMTLQKYAIENGRIIYDNASLGFYLEMTEVNHTGKGDFTQDVFGLDTHSEIEALTMKYGGIPYLNKVKTNVDLPLEIDMQQMKFTFESDKIRLNDLMLSTEGSLTIPNDESGILMDLKVDAAQSNLKNFLSLIPPIYAKNFDDLQTTGKFELDGVLKGTYSEKSIPGFNINLSIENGKMMYKSLPSAINNMQVKANVNNPGGNVDHTVINVPAFHLEFGREPLDGRLMVKNISSDPFIDMSINGKLELKQLTAIFPMQGIKLSGLVSANVSATGRKSSLDNGLYTEFQSAGKILVSNLNYSGKAISKPVIVNEATIDFNPGSINVTISEMKVGKSDFNLNGSIENYFGYIFSKKEALGGSFSLNSSLIDVNELMEAEKTEVKNSTVKWSVIEIPGNIAFAFNTKADHLLYDNMDIGNANGSVLIKNKTLYFQDMGLNALDGQVTMNGSYVVSAGKKPKVDIDFAIEQMNIQKAFKTFNTVKALAPVAQYTSGSFSSKLRFNAELNQNMIPELSSISAEGFSNIIQASITGFEPLNQLSDALKTDKLKQLEVNNLQTKFKIENGRLHISPFDVKTADFLMIVYGANGLDKSIDYTLKLDVSRKWLGEEANATVNDLVIQYNRKMGSTVELGENVKINALMGGNIFKPTIKLQLADEMKNQDQVALVINDKNEEIENKAKGEATKLKETGNAEVKKEEIKQKAIGKQNN